MDAKLDSTLKVVTALLTVATFFWGVRTFNVNAQHQAAVRQAEIEKDERTRRIAAAEPFLKQQLALFREATAVTATLASSKDQAEVAKARARFWQLYWGELGLVERGGVARAMADFGRALKEGTSQESLGPLALNLAHVCRDELAASWGTDAWKR